MCGIAGVIRHESQIPLGTLLGRMIATLSHRGPDGEGYLLGSQEHPSEYKLCHSTQEATLISERERGTFDIGLGHCRLSIIDLEMGQQPMSNEEGTLWVIFNGEIYNYLELREDLLRKGHHFRSRSDTEVIVHLYEEKGPDCLGDLVGMFAFAIWDGREQSLFLARDRVGKKPLCYWQKGEHFLFASELKAILQVPEVSREVDPYALDQYITYGYTPEFQSILKGIQKLPPAHYLLYQRGKVTVKRYWTLSCQPKIQLTEEEAIERLCGLLRQAVKDRLISDVPLGAFLSGGIDSSLVVAFMSELLDRPVKTFSVGFEEEEFSELPYARAVANRYHTDHHEFIVRPSILEILPKLIWHYNEPFGDSSSIPTYYLTKVSRNFVTVALNGDGGDESFAGYERYLGALWAHRTRALPRGLFSTSAQLVNAWAFLFPRQNTRELAKRRKFLEVLATSRDWRTHYHHWLGHCPEEDKKNLYTREFQIMLLESTNGSWYNRLCEECPSKDIIDITSYVDTHSYLPQDLLVKMDIASMANSLEARSPFLDHRLMEFAAKLPSSLKVRGLTGKYILRKIGERLLPKEVVERGKMGFGVPIGQWFRKDFSSYLEEVLLRQGASCHSYFEKEGIRALLKAHLSGKVNHTDKLWLLLNFELWHRMFIDSRTDSWDEKHGETAAGVGEEAHR